MTGTIDIKYIMVEAVLNKKEKPIAELIKTCKIGLFKGFREETINDNDIPSSFLLLKGKNEELLVLNLASYNILSIEKFTGLSKTITYLRASDEDQKQAVGILEKIVVGMDEANCMLASDDTMIDTSNYTQVPAIFGGTAETAKITSHHGCSPHTKSNSIIYNRSGTQVKPAVVKVKKPAVIKRTSKVPSKIALEEMEKKIKMIMNGKYKAELPEIAGDPPEIASGVGEEDYDSRCYMGG